MALLYSYSLLYLLAGIFAYELNALQVLVIAGVSFLVDKVVYRSYRRFFTILITVLTVIGVGIYLLYRWEYLEQVWLVIKEFMLVYFYSVSVSTVSIGPFHQIVALVFFGLVISAPLDLFIRRYKDYYHYLMVGTITLVLVGYLTKSMGSLKDREAFLILSATLIVYYFYSFYYQFTDYRRKFLPFATTIIVFLLVIVAGSRFLYSVDPRPLTQEKVRPAFVLSDDVELEVTVQDKLNYFRKDSFQVDDSFNFDYIEVMKIRSEEVDYLKAETFEIYYDGQWNKSKDLPYMSEEGMGVHTSDRVPAASYDEYYTLEEVRSIVRNINSNVVLVNNYAIIDPVFTQNIRVMNDTRRGTYFSNNTLETGYVYEYQAVVPKYGAKAFDNLVREYSDGPVPAALDQLHRPLTERYGEIGRLAAEITQGIDNKYDQALAIEQYLKTNYTYSTTPPVPPKGVDPILYFLFESGEGFCQQFASAHILMMRSLDIPSRYAVGFYVGDRNLEPEDYEEVIYEQDFLEEGVYSIFDANAHTWPEAWFPEVGWIMLEPTPGRVYKIEETDYNPYDFEGNDTEEEAVALPVVDPAHAWISAMVVLVAGLLFLIWIEVRRRVALGRRTPTDKMLDIHRMIRRVMKVGGFEKHLNQTPREFASFVDAYMFDLKDQSMKDLMQDYERVVYGAEEITQEELTKHRIYLKALRKAAGRRMNRFQRMYLALIIYRYHE